MDNTQQVAPEVPPGAKRIAHTVYRLCCSMLGVVAAFWALMTAWGVVIPIMQVWILLVLADFSLSYISRRVTYSAAIGRGQAAIKIFQDYQASGLVQVQQAAAPAAAPDKDGGPYL